jgi:pimeloyl-ACP methyl ester carboxylesterase
VIPILARTHRVLAPDLRGFGWSDAPPSGYDKRTMATDIVTLLDALEIERCSLVGHDWGGMIGFLLCVDHPARIDRYVALNSGHPWMRPDLRGVASAVTRVFPYQVLISTFGARYVTNAKLPAVERTMIQRGTWSTETAASYREQFEDPARVDASVQLYRTWILGGEYRRLRSELARRQLEVPTLYLHGEDDAVLRPHLVGSGVAQVEQLRFELVRGAGHFVQEDEPEHVAQRILEHVASER